MLVIRKQINLLLFAASVLFPLFSFPHQGSCAEIQPVVTSLAKLEALFKSHSRVDTSLDLVGTILSINATNQTLVLQNPPNIQLFNISGMSTTFKAGDAVRLTTEPCRLIRTDYGILIESLPLIEDTATNSTPEAKGS
ncbi:MAG: hypothetical protein JWM04_2165, partial [Verrucomicrobiales bacterium]|nr:hypothetical protein [Verrucomicrobiales bacterium]